MRKTLLAICLCLAAAAHSSEPLRVMSYNLRYGELATLQELGNAISSYQPDVVLLQEVDIHTHRTDAPHQHDRHFAAELGYHTGMFCAFGRAINYSGGYYGIAILSRYPMVKTERHQLPRPAREQRVLLTAEIETDSGKRVCVACTHLGLASADRVAQVAYVDSVLSRSEIPTLVGGDFNATPSSPEISQGMKSWKRALHNGAYTFPQRAPKEKIDYIFARPIESWTVKQAFVASAALSDHRPIVVDYEF